MCLEDWFLTGVERGNPSTLIDHRRGDGTAWTTGNRVEVLVDGDEYFRELHGVLCTLGPGDWVHFGDWEGDADERLCGPGTEVGLVLAELARRGVRVRGLLLASPRSVETSTMRRGHGRDASEVRPGVPGGRGSDREGDGQVDR